MKHGAERVEKYRVVQPEQECGHCLNAKNQPKHLPQKGGKTEVTPQQGLTYGLAAVEGHVIAPQQKNDACVGHDPQPAGLDEAQQYPLAEGAEHLAYVQRRKTGNADSRGCEKAGVNGADALPLGPACRQTEQY